MWSRRRGEAALIYTPRAEERVRSKLQLSAGNCSKLEQVWICLLAILTQDNNICRVGPQLIRTKIW
jgi:hypothetical protein